MAKLNHAKIIKSFEELINTTNGKDFFVGFLKTFSFPASTIGSVRISVSGEVIPGAAQRGCPLYLRCSMPDLMR